MVDCDFAFHASDSLPHGGALRWNWRARGIRGGNWNLAGLRPGLAAATAARGRKAAATSGTFAEPRQRRLVSRRAS